MVGKKDANSKGNAWKDYLLSIEKKPQISAKKHNSIGQKFKSFLEKIGIKKSKKSKSEEIKKQVEISAKEAKKWPVATRYENRPVEKDIYKKPKIDLKVITKKPKEQTFAKKKEIKTEKTQDKKKIHPSKMEKYITRIEEKQKARKREEKLLTETRTAEEKEKKFVKKNKKDIPKKIALLPKGKKKKIEKTKKRKKTKKIEKTKKRKKGKIEKLKSEKMITKLLKTEQSIAKKSIKEIKK